MSFEWDFQKNIENFEKHGVTFEQAQTIWADVYAIEFFDRIHSDTYEDRFIRIGKSTRMDMLLVVFCEHVEGVIRIISARPLTKREKVQYEEGI